jgi:enoyl-CoA hydratase/carnithine racemase|uniref:Enoyl-CoA hydratase/isomerase n=1 Tax=uncultured bacterium UPO67part1 TaxID=1776986 RepID=A0A126SYU0_9BACT|nr:enoyl-CoA hydratase/isomerase [uncultured bacterium UPO67part1]
MVAERYGDISVALEGHVALIEVHRPPNNHVNVELIRGLADALEAIDGDERVRASVLATEGKVFCGGADLQARGGIGEGNNAMVNPLYTAAVRLFACRKPVVAAIQGAAVGAGLGLALVADFRVAAPEARFTANFVKLGFHPGFGLTHTLPRLIGEQRASLMFQTGRRIKAEEALHWGLVDQVAPPETLRAEALRLAAEIAENAPLAVQSTRATLRRGIAEAVKAATDREFNEQNWLMKTADFAEGVRAVSERRPGAFSGR